MYKVKNKKTVNHIAVKALKSNRLRNVIAVIAIALTAMLFTTVFTIGMSFKEAFEQANFRQVGGYAHGGLKYLTEEQFHQLKDDPLIKEYGLRRFVGMPSDIPFNKSHVEVGYSDENQRKWMYLDPIQGDFPKEGTNEAATDTKVLSLLQIEPEVGTQFTMTFDVDGKETTETFTLSGFWDYDEAIVASHVLIPHSRAEEIFKKLGTIGNDGMTGTWNMDMMFKSSINIRGDVQKLLANHGYQDQDRSQSNYIATGVNWGYTGAQLADSIDPITVVGIVLLLLLIIFTGYLIIYNVFQISVAGDIRFYGLLKIIGTTPKQLKHIIRKQAFVLSAIGIPIGLLLGYLVGVTLAPVIFAQLNGLTMNVKSGSPLIFVGSALFALFTVLLSCSKPGKIAANVSPIEAVRYAKGTRSTRDTRKSVVGTSLSKMAHANLGRSRAKTAITVVSLSLAIILLNLTFTFTNGFDMDKYLRNVVVDFIISEAGYFQVTQGWGGVAVDEDAISLLQGQGELVDGGRVYGTVSPMLGFSPEEYYREKNKAYYSPENLEQLIDQAEKLPDGNISDRVQLYGMENFLLKKITTFNGNIEKLNDLSGNYIAAVYFEDDYGSLIPDSHWAKLGDKITIRYIDKLEYYNPDNGEVYEGIIPEDVSFRERVLEYHDVEYEVAALVVIPHSLSYRYYGADQFVLGADTFIRDTGSSTTMYYAFDATEESIPTMERFLSEYTQSEGAQYDYESKETYRAEFESFRNMFVLLGSVLSFVIGLVGILNFLNAVLTSIIARRKEFAMLQSIGMTGKQLKIMLIWESLYYTIGAVLLCLILSVTTGPLIGTAFESVFWFFSYRFTVLPILICIPFMLFISYVVPYLGYKSLVKQSIVERLREVE